MSFNLAEALDRDATQHSQEATGPTWPAPLHESAFHGPAGDAVRIIEPHSESDPAALLVQLLVTMGNMMGSGPHMKVEGDCHPGRLNVALVGETSKARKGTSWGHIKKIATHLDAEWSSYRIRSGLSTGEGLIYHVRDEKDGDPGVQDKRLLVIEPELSSILKRMGREGNTASAIIRQAYDDGNLAILTKTDPISATDAHISIIGHITLPELRRLLTETELANGFANRILWVCVKRSKLLPEGGNLRDQDLLKPIERMAAAIEGAQEIGEIHRDANSRAIWIKVYEKLSEGKPGLLGAVISRAEAQVTRLALVYALLDRSPVIKKEHLLGALAVWQYCEHSAKYIFSDRSGDRIIDRLIEALRDAPSGLTRTEISSLFSYNISRDRIDAAIDELVRLNRAKREMEKTAGRPVERVILITK